MKPSSVCILGIDYQIEYVDKPSDVDIYKRESLWGQIDFWTRTIRIYDNGRGLVDVWHTILHEVIHGISSALKLELDDEDKVDLLALGLTEVLFKNNWLNVERPNTRLETDAACAQDGDDLGESRGAAQPR